MQYIISIDLHFYERHQNFTVLKSKMKNCYFNLNRLIHIDDKNNFTFYGGRRKISMNLKAVKCSYQY